MYPQNYISLLNWNTTINSNLLTPPSPTVTIPCRHLYTGNTCKIPNDSRHPVANKLAGIRYLIKRMGNYCTQNAEAFIETINYSKYSA